MQEFKNPQEINTLEIFIEVLQLKCIFSSHFFHFITKVIQ